MFVWCVNAISKLGTKMYLGNKSSKAGGGGEKHTLSAAAAGTSTASSCAADGPGVSPGRRRAPVGRPRGHSTTPSHPCDEQAHKGAPCTTQSALYDGGGGLLGSWLGSGRAQYDRLLDCSTATLATDQG